MSEAGDVLRRAKERIGTPERWHQGSFAQMPGGGSASIDNPDACLCSDAALIAVDGCPIRTPGVSLCLSLAARARGFETASRLNDAAGTTHGDVMALFDEAAAMADAL